MVRPVQLQNEEFTGLRGRVAAFIENKHFIRFITVLILLNAITLGLETDHEIAKKHGALLYGFDGIVLSIFVVEIALKLFVYRFGFFRQGWNIFDFVIVGISLMPASGPFAILRALRIFRVLRLMSVVPSLRRVIGGLLQAIPGMASVVAILTLVFYVSSVLCTTLFGANPDPQMQELFGSVPASMYSLFQIMTLEGWSENIVRPTMDIYPWSWLFFIPFIIVTAFAVLNLFIGIIVDAMQQADRMTSTEDIDKAMQLSHEERMDLKAEIINLRNDIAELKEKP